MTAPTPLSNEQLGSGYGVVAYVHTNFTSVAMPGFTCDGVALNDVSIGACPVDSSGASICTCASCGVSALLPPHAETTSKAK